MKYYQFPEEFRERFKTKKDDLPSLIKSALWTIEHNIREIIQNNEARYNEKFPDWKLSIDNAVNQLHQFQIEYITITLPVHNTQFRNLENENQELKRSIEQLSNQIKNLEKQIQDLIKTITVVNETADKKKNQKDKNSVFNLF